MTQGGKLALPTVWCLLGKKAGDNAQVLALAHELGFPVEEKHILAQPWELLIHLGPRASLAGINRQLSSALQAPWPDLVISAGRRNEPVAHWIRRSSGGHTRLVHIGRPWAALDSYDLIVTTPQYFLPQQDNIFNNALPLHRLRENELALEGAACEPLWEHLPRPWIAVLVGGDSGRFVLTEAKAQRLGATCNALAKERGASLVISDSPRTPSRAQDALLSQISVPHYSYRCASGGHNPYRGMLALADEFVVTGESMSMLSEAASRAKPLHIFDMGDGESPWWQLRHNYRYKPLSHRLAMLAGPQRMRRDVGKIQQALVNSGAANWLGSPAGELSATPVENELGQTAERVRQLIRVNNS